MTTYDSKGPEPIGGKFINFDHIRFWVGNAKQAASYYCTKFGFKPHAYRGLETESKEVCSHVVKLNRVLFSFESALTPGNEEMGEHLVKHGDGVRDVAFTVQDLDTIMKVARERKASILRDVWEEQDEFGLVRMARIKTFGDTVHTLVDRTKYKGLFLPGYKEPVAEHDVLLDLLPAVSGINFIDHTVGNQPEDELERVVNWYEDSLVFHRFWSVDDSVIHTDYSSLRSIVITNWHQTIKMPINEPAPGKGRSQCQEFVDYYGSAGIQHIAFNTDDILSVVEPLRQRGVEFLPVPKEYYEEMKVRLENTKVNFDMKEDLSVLEKYNILVDFDEDGYLLQVFTKTMQDRPTLFLEVLQRNNHLGFGAGNFKAVFAAIEAQQKIRGTLLNN